MLKQKFATQFGSNIFIKVITMISGIFVARIAGPGVLGTLSYGISFVSIWNFINTVFAAGHMKLVSEGQNTGNCVTTYVYLRGISALLYIFFVLSWLFLQINITGAQFESNEQITVILILLAVMVVTQIYNILSNTFTAMLQQAKANLPYLIQKTIFHLGRIIFVFIGARAIGLSLWQLASLLLILPIVIKLYTQLQKGKWDKILAKKYIYYGIPTLLLGIIASVINYSDKLILAHYTNLEELGYYAAAMSIGGSFLLLSNTIGTIFFPLFSKLISEKNWAMVNRKNSIYQTFNTLFLLPLIAIIVIIAEPLLITVLSDKYLESVVPLKIILVSTYIAIIGTPYGNIILGMGKFYTNVLINASQLILFIISVTFFVSPKFLGLGATGLALNLMLIYLYKNVVYIIVSNKVGSLKYDRENLKRLFIIIIISILFYVLSLYIKTISLWWIYIVPVFYLATYGLLYIFKMINKDHLITLFEILNLKKTFKYFSDEINDKSN